MDRDELWEQNAPYTHPIEKPRFLSGFLLPFNDICNIGELHVFSIKGWQRKRPTMT
jgi:hypothetical protein